MAPGVAPGDLPRSEAGEEEADRLVRLDLALVVQPRVSQPADAGGLGNLILDCRLKLPNPLRAGPPARASLDPSLGEEVFTPTVTYRECLVDQSTWRRTRRRGRSS